MEPIHMVTWILAAICLGHCTSPEIVSIRLQRPRGFDRCGLEQTKDAKCLGLDRTIEFIRQEGIG
jgi:hypothetical protein